MIVIFWTLMWKINGASDLFFSSGKSKHLFWREREGAKAIVQVHKWKVSQKSLVTFSFVWKQSCAVSVFPLYRWGNWDPGGRTGTYCHSSTSPWLPSPSSCCTAHPLLPCYFGFCLSRLLWTGNPVIALQAVYLQIPKWHLSFIRKWNEISLICPWSSPWSAPHSICLQYVVDFRMYVRMLSHVQLCETPWTGAHQAPLSMGFSRQEYWSGLSFSPPGDLPDPGI